MTKTSTAFLATLCLLLGACASTDTAPSGATADDCFNIRQINSWDAIDDQHIYIEEAGNDSYLLTMFSSCPGIRFTNAIALSNHMGRVCPNNFGRVTYRDAGRVSSCQIGNVERIAGKEEGAALVESRTMQK